MAECAGGSKDGWNLPGFTITEESVHDFRELVRSYWSKANLPRYNEPSLWKVYLLTPSQWFKHHSLLIENTDTRACFTIELGFGETSVIPVSRQIDSKHYQHLVKVDLGTVSSTATQLFVTALECLQDFGDYQKIVNNCQLFCKVLAKRLGCSVVMTDAEKVVVGVGVGMSVAATAVLAKKLIDWLFGDKDS